MSALHKKYNWILFLFLALLLVIARLPSLDEPLDNDSGSVAFLARQLLRGESLYDKFHPTHHLPGIYYTFELAFKLFGDTPNAPKLLLLPWAFACTLLLYFIGNIYLNKQTGIIASVFFILVSSQRWIGGMTVEMEQFVNLPLIAGFFLLIILFRSQAPAWQFMWLGILGALSILYKVIFIALLVTVGILIFLTAWITRRESEAWKTMLSRLMWMVIGLIIPLAMVAAYFASLGLWMRFMLVFEFGFNYFNDPQLMNGWILPPPFGFPLVSMSINNSALLVFGLIGAYRLARRSIPVRNIDNLTDLAVVLWLVVSFALAGLRGGGFPYYVLPVVPPLTLMASIEINTVYQRLKSSSKPSANLVRSASLALVIGLFLWSNYSLYHDNAMYKLGRVSYDDFLQNVGEEEFASQQISNYVKAHTEPDDFIYLWGNRVEVYYYADRLPPVDILWPHYLAATGAPERIFDPKTKYIVLETLERMQRPQWLLDGLAAHCDFETALDGREIYFCQGH